MSARLAPCLAAVVVAVALIDGGAARAGGQMCSDAEELRAAAAARRWKRQGRAAIPALIRALGSRNLCLVFAAEDRLERIGLVAARAVLRSLDRRGRRDPDRPGHPAASVLTNMLCSARAAAASWRRIEAQLVAAVASKNRRRARGALAVLGELAAREPHECQGRQRVQPAIQRALPAIARLLDAKHPLCEHALAAVSQYGAHAAPIAGALVPLLAAARHQSAALEALRSIGAGASAAVERLRALVRAGDLARRVDVARVIGRIGPGARAARADLFALLSALGRGKPSSYTSTWVARTIDAIAALGRPWTGEQQAAVLSVMRDVKAGFFARLAAARAARRCAAPSSLWRADRKLGGAIERKAALVRQMASPGPQKLPPPEYQAVRRVRDALNVCRAEAGHGVVPDGRFRDAHQRKLRSNERLAACIADRLCGPDQATYGRTLDACCRAAYGKSLPAWCR